MDVTVEDEVETPPTTTGDGEYPLFPALLPPAAAAAAAARRTGADDDAVEASVEGDAENDTENDADERGAASTLAGAFVGFSGRTLEEQERDTEADGDGDLASVGKGRRDVERGAGTNEEEEEDDDVVGVYDVDDADDSGDDSRGVAADRGATTATSSAAAATGPPFALSRVKKLLKSFATTSRVISSDAAAEIGSMAALVVADLTAVATEFARRRRRGSGSGSGSGSVTVTYDDIAEAVARCDRFAFLADAIPLAPARAPGGGTSFWQQGRTKGEA